MAYSPLSSSCCEPAGEGTLWVGCGAGREGLGLEICRAGWVANVAPRFAAKARRRPSLARRLAGDSSSFSAKSSAAPSHSLSVRAAASAASAAETLDLEPEPEPERGEREPRGDLPAGVRALWMLEMLPSAVGRAGVATGRRLGGIVLSCLSKRDTEPD